MINYSNIQKEWIVSATARRVYRATATASAAFVVFKLLVGTGNLPSIMLPLVMPLLFIGAMCSAITLIGMECFLFLFDTSSGLKQVFWFLILLVPLGMFMYCFRVYSRSSAFDTISQEHSMRASA
jgi:hypothetical protein